MPKGLNSYRTLTGCHMAEDTTNPTAEEIADAAKETDASTDETESGGAKDTDIDYEAIAKAERERADALAKKIAEDAYKYRQSKKEKDTEETTNDEDKPLTKKDLESLLSKERETTEKRLTESKAFEIALANTSSETEAKAAVEFWKSRVTPTGNLQDDVLFAIGGLNAKRIVAQNSELKRSLAAKGRVSHDTGGVHPDAATRDEPKLASQDVQAIKAAGMAWDGVKGLYKKALGRNQFYYFDPKTKKKWRA